MQFCNGKSCSCEAEDGACSLSQAFSWGEIEVGIGVDCWQRAVWEANGAPGLASEVDCSCDVGVYEGVQAKTWDSCGFDDWFLLSN